MPRMTSRHTKAQSSMDERVFTDEEGRVWSVALDKRDEPAAALVFRCISDGRQSVRAMAVDPAALDDALDDALRVWLYHAPRIGSLS